MIVDIKWHLLCHKTYSKWKSYFWKLLEQAHKWALTNVCVGIQWCVMCSQQKPCMYGFFFFFLVNCVENVNKHQVVLVKYINELWQMCVLESKGVTCTQQKPCMYGIYLFIYFLVNCMENINKHRLVLVKYIKRQRNLSKKGKRDTK